MNVPGIDGMILVLVVLKLEALPRPSVHVDLKEDLLSFSSWSLFHHSRHLDRHRPTLTSVFTLIHLGAHA